MARTWTILVLTLTTAVGPLPCCCVAARLDSLLRDSGVPTESVPPCCCHEPTDDAPSQPLDGPHCPCRARASLPVLTTAAPEKARSPGESLSYLLPFDGLSLPSGVSPLRASAKGDSHVDDPLGFPSPRTLLRVFHLLRC